MCPAGRAVGRRAAPRGPLGDPCRPVRQRLGAQRCGYGFWPRCRLSCQRCHYVVSNLGLTTRHESRAPTGLASVTRRHCSVYRRCVWHVCRAPTGAWHFLVLSQPTAAPPQQVVHGRRPCGHSRKRRRGTGPARSRLSEGSLARAALSAPSMGPQQSP